jgi:hypothetical protein
LIQDRGGAAFPSIAGFRIDFIILRGVTPPGGTSRLSRVQDLKRGTHKDIGPKDIFEMADRKSVTGYREKAGYMAPLPRVGGAFLPNLEL